MTRFNKYFNKYFDGSRYKWSNSGSVYELMAINSDRVIRFNYIISKYDKTTFYFLIEAKAYPMGTTPVPKPIFIFVDKELNPIEEDKFSYAIRRFR